jgi:pimeloyl-ACP methyl ester carboxylesterase
LQVVANAGHWLHAEQPQVVNSLIAAFLGENQS